MKRIPASLGLVAALIIAAGAQVVTQLATAAPAAAVPQMVTAIASSSTTADPVKRVVAQCPVGDAVIGGGARIYDFDANQVRLTESKAIWASPYATQWAATGVAPIGFTGIWNITTYVICAPPPPGYIIYYISTPVGIESYKETSVTCDTGTMLSAGFSVFEPPATTAPRNVGIASMLLDGPKTVYVDAHTQQSGGGNAGPWWLNASVICAQLPGATLADTTVTGQGGLVYCPAGTKAHGVFGGVLDDSGDAFLDEIRSGNLALANGVTNLTQAPSGGTVEIQALCAP